MDALEPIKHSGRDHPRKRPDKLHADKAYDAKKCRKALRKRGIKSRIARKDKEPSSVSTTCRREGFATLSKCRAGR